MTIKATLPLSLELRALNGQQQQKERKVGRIYVIVIVPIMVVNILFIQKQ
jgi:hypothetical protein